MKVAIAALLAASLALGACGTAQPAPGATGISSGLAATRLDVGKALDAAQASFDAAVKGADAVIKTGILPAATVAAIDKIADQGDADFKAARQFYAASDLANTSAQLAAISTLATDLSGLVKTQ